MHVHTWLLGSVWLAIALGLAGCGETHDAGDAGPAPDVVALPDAPVPPDPVQFCTDREAYRCAREFAAARIDAAAYNTCAGAIDAQCQDFAWPAGCAVTHARADACITALSDAARVSMTYEMIVQCTEAALCDP